MTKNFEDFEKQALSLSEKERGKLAASMIRSLPGVLHDEDEGMAAALRRDAELDANPGLEVSLEQLDTAVRERRK
jgi:hypothetical protein